MERRAWLLFALFVALSLFFAITRPYASGPDPCENIIVQPGDEVTAEVAFLLGLYLKAYGAMTPSLNKRGNEYIRISSCLDHDAADRVDQALTRKATDAQK